MIHIFLIHSAITELLAIEVIKKENISSNNLYYIFDRNYIPFSLKGKELTLDYNCTYHYLKKPFSRVKYDKKWLNYFNNLISNNQYSLYLPHSMLSKYNILITNSLCLSYSYIEEGLAAYVEDFFTFENTTGKSLIRSIFWGSYTRELFNRGKFFVNTKKLNKCYCLHEFAFLPFKHKRVFLTINNQLPIKFNDFPSFDAIIIFDGLSFRGLVDLNSIIKILNDVILNTIERLKYKTVAIKFHPDQKNDPNEILILRTILNKYFQIHNISSIELPFDFPLEIYFAKNKVDVFTFVSSLGFYATLFNNNSFTVRKRIYKLCSDIKSIKSVDNLLIHI